MDVRALAYALAIGCTSAEAIDGRDAGAMVADAGRDAGRAAMDSGHDSGRAEGLDAHRDRLLVTLGEPCATWASFDESQRAVFLTITHRFFLSQTPDGLSMLDHLERVFAVLGGGSSGTSCGGSENNRLFLGIDAYLHGLLVDTWNGARAIGDGGGSTWLRTRDAAGPHDPFDASDESDIGLRCTAFFEDSDSRPPTAQAHFFLAGSEVPIARGDIMLPADPRMLEIDQDYNCVHDSNPTCRDFEDRYRDHYGDFGCEWVPSACTAVGTGCYRSVE